MTDAPPLKWYNIDKYGIDRYQNLVMYLYKTPAWIPEILFPILRAISGVAIDFHCFGVPQQEIQTVNGNQSMLFLIAKLIELSVLQNFLFVELRICIQEK